jgi:hypothetical protein
VVNALITQVLALLMLQDLGDLSRVAQDGRRVRASAGASSVRREQTLQALMQEARAHLEAVTHEAADPALSARRAAALTRGAQQRLDRLEAALTQIPDVTATKKRSGATDATVRISTTDPDARIMKMGDGGFRPAFNVRCATTADAARAIVGVDVTHRGSDTGQSTPMLQQIEQRTGGRPAEMLVDGGYAQHEALDQAAQQQVTLYAPVPKPRKGDTRDPHAPREDDSEVAPPGASAWAPRRPGPSTRSAPRPRRPSTPTPRNTAGSTACPGAAWTRPWAPRRCSPSPTTSCA